MKRYRLLVRLAAGLGFCLLAGDAVAFSAGEAANPPQPVAGAIVVPVAADCYTIGQKIAEKNGGQLARAAPQMRSGHSVCVIVVLVPPRDGQRPRRAEFIVPTK